MSPHGGPQAGLTEGETLPAADLDALAQPNLQSPASVGKMGFAPDDDTPHEVTIASIAPDGRGLNAALLRLAIPTTGAGWLKASFLFADTWSAGKLSTAALAGLSAASFFVWMFHSLSSLNSTGALCFVAQARGRNDFSAVRAVWTKSVVQAIGFGVVMSAVFLATAPPVLGMLDLTAPVVEQARHYLVVIALMGPAFWLFDALERAFRAVGDARTPLVVVGVTAVINVVLNPLLALGWGPFPSLGIDGIGIATGVSWIVGAGVLFRVAYLRGFIGRSSSSAPGMWAFCRVGAPTAISAVGFDLIWVLMVPLIAVGGPAAIAAVSIGHRLESIAWLTAQGLGAATSTLVGQSVGAWRTRLAHAVTFRAATWSVVCSGAWAIFLLVFGREAMGIFTDDLATIEVGLDYIALAAIALVFQTLEVIFIAGFSGGGRTGLPSAITVVIYGIRWPLALALVPLWGLAGVFAAIGITASAAGILVAIAYGRVGPGSVAFDRAHAPHGAGILDASTPRSAA